MSRLILLALSCLIAPLMGCGTSPAAFQAPAAPPVPAVPTFTSFDPPNAVGTVASSINASGSIGYYSDTKGVDHGFVRTPNGTITAVDPPTAITIAGWGTSGLSINDSGAITGFYIDNSGVMHGFVWQ